MKSRLDPVGLVLVIFALGNLGNAAWMLATPLGWYTTLPAGVPDFGPLNEHFVRDLGAMFLVSGAALFYSALQRSWRKVVVACNLGWYAVHSLVHVYDTLRGAVGKVHFVIDLPLVYVPTIILFAIFVLVRKHEASA